jgi:hypothetical protein
MLYPSPVVCVKGRRWSFGLLGRAGVGFSLHSSLLAIFGFESTYLLRTQNWVWR